MSSVSCSICWEVVTSTCVVSYLLCGHVYHRDCLAKWLTTSKTCPECRHCVTDTKRIYLNLVSDPEIEVLNSELTRKKAEYQFLTTDNYIQGAIIKQLETQISTKDEELHLSTKRYDELKSNTTSTIHQNDKLKLELDMQQKQQVHLTTEIADLRSQLEASQTKNIEITNSTVALKEFHRQQVKQIADLHSEILNLSERLDQFRGLFVAANGKLEVQVQENELIRSERDLLACQNAGLIEEVNNLKRQVDDHLLQSINNEYVDLLEETVQSTYKNFKIDFEPHTFSQHHPQNKQIMYEYRASNENLKIKFVKSKIKEVCNDNLDRLHKVCKKNLKNKLVKSDLHQVSNDNLKIKLIKSKLNWMCVKA